MMESGTYRIDFTDDGSGNLSGQVSFAPGGGTDYYPLGAPVPVSAGSWLSVAPACIDCEPQTTVEGGQGGAHEGRSSAGTSASKPASKPAETRRPGPGGGAGGAVSPR